MWIPTPIYERIPQCLVLLGLLFISSGFYLGFDFELSFVYFGTGVFCLAWGVGIFIVRRSYRTGPQAQQEEPIDQPS
jgi:hypothetical protein